MKRIFTFLFLLACLAVGGLVIAGEDAGLAGAAFVKTKNITSAGGQTFFKVGTLASPSISFQGDENCGIYDKEGADNINFVTHGITRFGIGTASINSVLPLYCGNSAYLNSSSVSSTVPVFTFVSNLTAGLGRYAVGMPSMIASSTERTRWTQKHIYNPQVDSGGIFISDTSVKSWRLTTDATAARLTTDGADSATTNRWDLASGTAVAGSIDVIGIATSAARPFVSYSFRFSAMRVNSTVTVATMSRDIYEDSTLTGCDADLAQDGESFYVNVTGSSTANIRWAATARYTEVNQP